MNIKKGDAMSIVAVALIFLVRVAIPFTIMISLGEWIHRREEQYWLKM